MRKRFIPVLLAGAMLFSCSDTGAAPADGDGFETVSSMELEYAEQFTVDRCRNGCSVITIGGDKFLLIPENSGDITVPGGMTALYQPLGEIYAASSSAVDLFDCIDCLDGIGFVSTDKRNWTLPSVVSALDSGNILYAGKYRAPDFEMLLTGGCGLALENTMIYHTPEVKEQLEELDIPVMVEYSSYESHPLGRMEWVKLYGLLTGREAEADDFFDRKTARFREITAETLPGDARKTVAFFYISSSGMVNVRKPGDYISRMIELAGGEYIFTAEELNVDENALSTMNMQPEAFYSMASGADILIYNSTVDGELESIDELVRRAPLLADFKAVKEGSVWCTGKNMFQKTSGSADMIYDLFEVINGGDGELEFLTRLEEQ